MKKVTEGPSLGIFKRSIHYDELLDEPSISPPDSESFLSGPGTTATSLSDGETDSSLVGRPIQSSASRNLSDNIKESLILSAKGVDMPFSSSLSGSCEDQDCKFGSANFSQIHDGHNLPKSSVEDGVHKESKKKLTAPLKSGSFSRMGKSSFTGQRSSKAPLPPPSSVLGQQQMSAASRNIVQLDFCNRATSEDEGANLGEESRNPLTPNQTSEQPGPTARTSPSLMSSAAKLAASIHQGSRRALGSWRVLGEEFSPLEDSATEDNADIDELEDSKVYPKEDQEPPRKDLKSGSLKGSSHSRSKYESFESSVAGQPLLLDSATDVATSPLPASQPEASKQNAPPASITSAHRSTQDSVSRANQLSQPLRPQSAPHLGSNSRHPAGISEEAMYDIFEPRPDLATDAAADGSRIPTAASLAEVKSMKEVACKRAAETGEAVVRWKRSRLRDLEGCGLEESREILEGSGRLKWEGFAGHEALLALQRGSHLRKKWVSNTSAEAAAQVPKTERLIRCRLEGSKVILHYHHQASGAPPPGQRGGRRGESLRRNVQGVKGLLDKEEVVTRVQRVEVSGEGWQRGSCILLHTGKGILALEAPDAVTHATWLLGLNAALESCQVRTRATLLEAPLQLIPRNSMFVVTPPPGGPPP